MPTKICPTDSSILAPTPYIFSLVTLLIDITGMILQTVCAGTLGVGEEASAVALIGFCLIRRGNE